MNAHNHTDLQERVLSAKRDKLLARGDVYSLTRFGSSARGETDEKSDIDLLILTRYKLS